MTSISNHLDELIDEKTAAKLFGLSPRFFQARRLSGDGPRFVRISSRCIRYRKEDLAEWIKRRLHAPEEGLQKGSIETSTAEPRS